MANPGTSKAIEALAAAIGDKTYLDVAKWHLYLNDAKLHTVLAEQIYPLLAEDRFTEAALKDILANIPVAIGGGKKELPLADLIPASGPADLAEAVEEYRRDM